MSMRSRFLTLIPILIPSALLAQEGGSLFTSDFPPEEFAARRAKVMDAIGPEAIALVQGAPTPVGYVRFRQSNEFYYLTGIEAPHAYLLIDGATRESTLYLPDQKAGRERSEGKVLSTADADLITNELGFDAVHAPAVMTEHLQEHTKRQPVPAVYTMFSPAEGLSVSRDLGRRRVSDIATDPWDGRPSREEHFISLIKGRFPVFEVQDLTSILDQLRLIKSERELALIRKATRLSGLGLMEAMRSTEPEIHERDLDAVAKYVFFLNGAQGQGYYSLIASASNAYFPHYNAGKRLMQDGDFLLMDYAPDVGYYTSDLTRMWPVNGKFSPWQRELYGFYVGCYRAVLDHIRPHVTGQQVVKEALVEMEKILAASSFSKLEYQRAAEGFVASYRSRSDNPRTGLGHGVGMAVHDVGRSNGQLLPGMVFTIEPALRVPEERIYIRLEDLIIITEDGAEITSDFLPMDMDGIEKLMQESGMLQRYPKLVRGSNR